MKTTLIFSLSILFSLSVFAQPANWDAKKNFTILSYNVENLFDTIDIENKSDEEFTPQSAKMWNSERYYKKLNDLATVISSINAQELPEIIGLVEIENIQVLNDLVLTEKLKPANYKVILDEGPDPRGIDCGLLYNPKEFKYVSHKTLAVRFPFAENKRTRDILYVKGKVKKETIHLFVNHWSSRRNGQEASEPKRVESAKVLKHNVDSILMLDPNASIIMMGDFNDEPSNKSIKETLDAGEINSNKTLVNLMYDLHNQKKGTFYYKGEYNMIDNLIVTKPLLLNTKGFRLLDKSGFIYNPDFICYTNKNGDKSPSKTYGGKNYYGGFSDHFPIYATFIVK
ncbi:MAG: endonuclease/exonuclease/phosphatase family protein [Salinivirgaceae bacterium]|nr:endonuclease/exonuclease/phosphatase family protein [Salinivirgaceae bacterium]